MAVKHTKSQYEAVQGFIMDFLDGQCCDLETLQKIEEISRKDHAPECGLGSTPACTCGKKEATEFVHLCKKAEVVSETLA